MKIVNTKNTKALIALILTVLLSFSLFTACSKPEETEDPGTSTETKTEELKVVRIGGIIENLGESAAIAKTQGYFEEELAKVGFKPEYSAFAQAGPALNEALATKAIDFGIYADFPQLVLYDKGVDVRVIAPVTTAQHYAIIVNEQSGIKSVKDLEGKKIIVGKGTILQKIFEDIVVENNLDINNIEQLNALADQFSVFASGEADAVISTTLGITAIKAQSGGEVIFSTQSNPELATVATLVGRGEFLDENPDVAKALIRALYRAYEYAAANPEGAYEALSSDLAPAALVKAIHSFDLSFTYFKPEFTDASIEQIDAVNTFLADQQLISKKVDLTKFVDTSYYEAVKDEFEK